MSARLYAVALVFALLSTLLLLSGCAAAERVLNACDTGRWRGWSSDEACRVLDQQGARHVHR